jgi:hypothetical protein
LFVVLLVMAPPSQELEPPTNPGRFTRGDYTDQSYTGERAANAAAKHGITLEVVKLPEARLS